MSIWKDRAGRYHVAIQRGGTRLHRTCSPEAAWRDAKRKEAELEHSFSSAKSGKVLIEDAIAHWLKTEVQHQKARKGTEGNAYALAEWVRGKSLQEVGKVADSYREANRGVLTNSTINRRLAVLRRVANLAYRRWGWLDHPAGDKIGFLTENPARERFLTRSEIAKLLRGIPNRSMRKAALVAAFTGLRRGELARLRPINVQGDSIYVGNTKTGRPRVVPVVRHLRFALRRLPFGVHADTLTHAVQRALPGVRFHDLRHTAASLLVQGGVDLYRVGAILGHSDIRTTKRYAHLDIASLRAAMDTLERKPAPRLHQSAVDKKTGTEDK